MKRCLLIMAFLLFSNVARAETIYPYDITVKDAYYFKNTNFHSLSNEEIDNRLSITSYYLGVTDTVANFHSENKEEFKCIARPVAIWFDIIFEDYRQNKIQGTDYFYTIYIDTIYRICNIKHK